jgi:hypothetical protein
MTASSPFRRFHRLGGRELALFAEAACALTLATAAIRILPFRTVVRTMGYGGAEQDRGQADADVALEVRRAVKRAARRLPWTIVCFPEGLAAHWMLRRRGVPSLVHYGIRQAESELTAHVWVTLGETVVIGEETTNLHTGVAVFPPPP